MRHLFLYILSALMLLTACGPGKDRMRLEGKFKNLTDAEFYVYADGDAFSGMDTVKIEGGKFTYERTLTEPTVLTLLYPNFSRTYIIGEPGKTLEFTANAEKLSEANVTGTDANERLTKFRLAAAQKQQSNMHLAAAMYVRDNAATPDALAVFMQYFSDVENYNAKEALPLLDLLKKSQPRSGAVASLDTRLRPLLKNGEGQALMDFSATTIDGGSVKRSDYTGTKLLFVFFASWQTDSHVALGELKRLQRAFGSNFKAVGVSLDYSKDECRAIMQRDSVTVPVVCEGQAFASPLMQNLGVRYVPGNLLIGADGRVLGRDLKAARLEALLSKK